MAWIIGESLVASRWSIVNDGWLSFSDESDIRHRFADIFSLWLEIFGFYGLFKFASEFFGPK